MASCVWEALRKHSEAIGQVFQVRLLEIQGKYTAAHEAEAGLERELAQVREQRQEELQPAPGSPLARVSRAVQ